MTSLHGAVKASMSSLLFNWEIMGAVEYSLTMGVDLNSRISAQGNNSIFCSTYRMGYYLIITARLQPHLHDIRLALGKGVRSHPALLRICETLAISFVKPRHHHVFPLPDDWPAAERAP